MNTCDNCGDLIDLDTTDAVDPDRYCSETCEEQADKAQRMEAAGMFDEDYMPEDMDFADPGGRSALRAGPRIHPCPNCGAANRLSGKDVALGYQCDACADRAEGGQFFSDGY